MIKVLASCPWGLLTANGVDVLTEIYATAAAGEAVTDAMTDGRKARKYIRIGQNVPKGGYKYFLGT